MTHRYFEENLEIARRNLPELADDVRQALALRLDEAPPSKKYDFVGDALTKKELDAGLSAEGRVHRLRKAGLWALLHFPLQFIPIHMFLSWESGNRILKGSDQVTRFIKTKEKQRRMIETLNLRTVTYITQRQRSDDPTTVDGFRLTAGGDDYTRNVNAHNSRRMGRIMQRAYADVGNDRIRLEDVSNPALRKHLKQDKDILNNLQKSGVIAHFTNTGTQMLGEGKEHPESKK